MPFLCTAFFFNYSEAQLNCYVFPSQVNLWVSVVSSIWLTLWLLSCCRVNNPAFTSYGLSFSRLLIFVKLTLSRGQQFAQQIQQQNPELIEQLRNHVRSRSFSGSTEEHSWFKGQESKPGSTNSKRHTIASSKYHHCNSFQTWDGKSFVCVFLVICGKQIHHTQILNMSCMYVYWCLCKWSISRTGDNIAMYKGAF